MHVGNVDAHEDQKLKAGDAQTYKIYALCVCFRYRSRGTEKAVLERELDIAVGGYRSMVTEGLCWKDSCRI